MSVHTVLIIMCECVCVCVCVWCSTYMYLTFFLTHRSLVQEERDTFKAKCLKSQNNMEELRERLEYEKNGRLLSIHTVEPLIKDTSQMRTVPS